MRKALLAASVLAISLGEDISSNSDSKLSTLKLEGASVQRFSPFQCVIKVRDEVDKIMRVQNEKSFHSLASLERIDSIFQQAFISAQRLVERPQDKAMRNKFSFSLTNLCDFYTKYFPNYDFTMYLTQMTESIKQNPENAPKTAQDFLDNFKGL